MEISNDIRTKVFAQYLGQPFKVILNDKSFNITECNLGTIQLLNTEDVLLLKSLSNIKFEDAVEVAKLNGLEGNIVRDEKHSDLFIEKQGVVTKKYMQIHNSSICFYDNSNCDCDVQEASLQSYQYLISKGYDLPHYLLGGKTLKEVGLAIHEKKY